MGEYDFRGRDTSDVDPVTEDFAHRVIGAAIEFHANLGAGLPETVYRRALMHELQLRGLSCDTEVPVPVHYKGVLVGKGRLDLLVERRLIVEIKVVEALTPTHRAQVIAYLQAPNLQLCLLINFNVTVLHDGIKRVVKTR